MNFKISKILFFPNRLLSTPNVSRTFPNTSQLQNKSPRRQNSCSEAVDGDDGGDDPVDADDGIYVDVFFLANYHYISFKYCCGHGGD